MKQYDPNNPNAHGCIVGEPNNVYHENPAVSHSKLWEFAARPSVYHGKYVTGEAPRESSDALRIGSAFHCLVLEGEERFREECVTLPPLSFRSKADKERAVEELNRTLRSPLPSEALEALYSAKKEDIEEFFKAHDGKLHVTEDEMELFTTMRKSIEANDVANELLSKGLPEVVFRTPKPEGGFALQCRTDWLNLEGCAFTDGQPYYLDLKTIESFERWNAEFRNRRYYAAPPFYRSVVEAVTGKDAPRMYWIVVEKQWPFACVVVSATQDAYDRGLAEVNAALHRMKAAYDSGDFSDPRVIETDLPEWKYRQEL